MASVSRSGRAAQPDQSEIEIQGGYVTVDGKAPPKTGGGIRGRNSRGYSEKSSSNARKELMKMRPADHVLWIAPQDRMMPKHATQLVRMFCKELRARHPKFSAFAKLEPQRRFSADICLLIWNMDSVTQEELKTMWEDLSGGSTLVLLREVNPEKWDRLIAYVVKAWAVYRKCIGFKGWKPRKVPRSPRRGWLWEHFHRRAVGLPSSLVRKSQVVSGHKERGRLPVRASRGGYRAHLMSKGMGRLNPSERAAFLTWYTFHGIAGFFTFKGDVPYEPKRRRRVSHDVAELIRGEANRRREFAEAPLARPGERVSLSSPGDVERVMHYIRLSEKELSRASS